MNEVDAARVADALESIAQDVEALVEVTASISTALNDDTVAKAVIRIQQSLGSINESPE